jgi:hypothetical protein
MSEQALDVRKSLRIVRRHRAIVGIAVLLGVLVGLLASTGASPETAKARAGK